MVDSVLDRLREEAKKKVGLIREITTKLTEAEYAVLSKNSDELGMEMGDLLREFILTTSAYGEKSIMKKSKAKVVGKTVNAKAGNE